MNLENFLVEVLQADNKDIDKGAHASSSPNGDVRTEVFDSTLEQVGVPKMLACEVSTHNPQFACAIFNAERTASQARTPPSMVQLM